MGELQKWWNLVRFGLPAVLAALTVLVFAPEGASPGETLLWGLIVLLATGIVAESGYRRAVRRQQDREAEERANR